ncbi:amino acid ABC transporter permease [Clostridium perfringens]|uniref:amino acid ABC transporter permease n=1 Tax=Clostridium perfringens TaxID=1502 RepID=UPI002912B1DD|nr:amino acid ABC transporter permease [Clostridium perfringens]EJT6169566.1 amino acid ABC transporter permease [Clostridium perfringens]EJT6540289.1 amino acid ABC transporter permease [Clostridium perfringens]EJT6565296.1 amino acid ABC transporter permease [Clostridium perfringens]MBS5994151.1 amino acid ABC transporter permease [Clostridium perfringens]MDM0996751.1 amino acid ABC transporter permease [Clostridium perfringens]
MNYIITLMPSIIEGLKNTLGVFILTLLLSIPLGIIIAILRLSNIKIVNFISSLYVLVMRGTPLLLQLIFIFFGLPIIGVSIDRFPAAIIAFTLNYAAYFGEIFRSGIKDIDKGQFEASKILGLSKWFTFKKIILPQSFKKILPSIANEVITLVKDTSLVYVVGIGELLRAGKIASNRDASLLPLFLIGIIYLLLIGILTKIFNRLEKKYSYYN